MGLVFVLRANNAEIPFLVHKLSEGNLDTHAMNDLNSYIILCCFNLNRSPLTYSGFSHFLILDSFTLLQIHPVFTATFVPPLLSAITALT